MQKKSDHILFDIEDNKTNILTTLEMGSYVINGTKDRYVIYDIYVKNNIWLYWHQKFCMYYSNLTLGSKLVKMLAYLGCSTGHTHFLTDQNTKNNGLPKFAPWSHALRSNKNMSFFLASRHSSSNEFLIDFPLAQGLSYFLLYTV